MAAEGEAGHSQWCKKEEEEAVAGREEEAVAAAEAGRRKRSTCCVCRRRREGWADARRVEGAERVHSDSDASGSQRTTLRQLLAEAEAVGTQLRQ